MEQLVSVQYAMKIVAIKVVLLLYGFAFGRIAHDKNLSTDRIPTNSFVNILNQNNLFQFTKLLHNSIPVPVNTFLVERVTQLSGGFALF